MPIEISTLQKRPDLLHPLAQWHQQEWRTSGRSVPITRRVQRLRSHLDSERLPTTWVGTDHGELVGSVSLVDYVFQQDNNTSAWVANLFVVPNYRSQGLGRQLLAHAQGQAEEADLQRLLLFTPKHRDFYERQDWEFLHQARVQGQWVDVMQKNFSVPSYGVALQQRCTHDQTSPDSLSHW